MSCADRYLRSMCSGRSDRGSISFAHLHARTNSEALWTGRPPASCRGGRRSQMHCKISATLAIGQQSPSGTAFVIIDAPMAIVKPSDRPLARRTPHTTAPDAQQQPGADHAAEMREMRDALLRAGDAQEKLQRGVQEDEDARRHRDRRKQQHDAVVREVDRITEQKP